MSKNKMTKKELKKANVVLGNVIDEIAEEALEDISGLLNHIHVLENQIADCDIEVNRLNVIIDYLENR